MTSHLNRVRAFFGDICAAEVGTVAINRFIDKMKAQKKQNSTINRSLQLLSQAFKLAKACDPPMVHREPTVPRLPEDNVRKGKFLPEQAEAIFAALPAYMSHIAQFAYETGTRTGEILKLQWSYLGPKAISVPATDTKNRKPRSIVMTDRLVEIISERRKVRVPGCKFVFHNDGHVIRDYRKCWHAAAVMTGVGHFYCRTCRDDQGQYISVLDAKKICSKCGAKWTKKKPKYIGKIVHDFRRTAAHEMWKAGIPAEDCKLVTGHETDSMFMRYADLFSDEEKQQKQLEVQHRRREWRERESQASVAMVQ